MSSSSNTSVLQVECPSCLKKANHRPEIAGKKVRCKCGHTMVYPSADELSAKLAAEDAMYTFADDVPVNQTATAPADTKPLRAAPVPQPVVGIPDSVQQVLLNRLGAMPRKSEARKALDTLKEQREADLEAITRPSPVREIIIPIPVLMFGLFLCYVEAVKFAPDRAANMGEAVMNVLMRAGFSVALMFGAMFFACTALEVNFLTSFKRALLRFAAIAVGPCAIYGICSHDTTVGGAILGITLSLAAYAVLFQGLMRTNLRDTGICVAMTWIFIAGAQYAGYKLDAAIRSAWF